MKVAILAGSNRKHSTSTKLCLYISNLLQQKGGETELFDLYRKPLPLFSPDDESKDENVHHLKSLARRAEAIVLSSPEYHGGMSGVLKNALDYLGKEHFAGKAVLSVTSAGGSVGTSCLLQMQACVRYVHGVNCPEWISLGGPNRQFNGKGEPADEEIRRRVLRVVDQFVELAVKLQRSVNE